MFEKIKKLIPDLSVFYSSVTLTLLLIISQIVVYIKKTSYYSYFNVQSIFIEIDLYNDLYNLFNYFIIFCAIIIEMLLLDNIVVYMYTNRKNINSFRQFLDLLRTIAILYGLSILLNIFIDFLVTGCIIINSFYFIFPLILTLCSIVIRLLISIAKKGRAEDIDNNDVKFNRLLFILLIILSFLCIKNYISDNAISAAKNARSFYIISDSNIVLYQTRDNILVTDFWYSGDNEIIIDTSKITKKRIDNITLELKTFDKVSLLGNSNGN